MNCFPRDQSLSVYCQPMGQKQRSQVKSGQKKPRKNDVITGSSRSRTATKKSPQNITLQHCTFFATSPSRSRRTMRATYPKDKVGTSRFQVNIENEGSHLYARVFVKTSNLVISRRCCAEYRKNTC